VSGKEQRLERKRVYKEKIEQLLQEINMCEDGVSGCTSWKKKTRMKKEGMRVEGAWGLDEWTAGLASHKAKDRSVESEWSRPMHSPGFSALQRAWREIYSE
jgi:hypothetical protein